MNHREIKAAYDRDGVVRLRRFFEPGKVAAIRAELDRYIREDLPSRPADACTREPDGVSIRNLWRLDRHDGYFRALGESPEMLELAGVLVNGTPLLQAVETFNKPARVGTGVPHHQDNAYFCQAPPDMLTLWVALDPVTVENGAVYFDLGSHREGLRPTRPSGVKGNSIGLAEIPATPREDLLCATLEPGDATIHHCEVIHHSMPNHTDDPRLGLLFVYRGAHTRTDPALKATYTAAATATPPA